MRFHHHHQPCGSCGTGGNSFVVLFVINRYLSYYQINKAKYTNNEQCPKRVVKNPLSLDRCKEIYKSNSIIFDIM